MSNVPAGVPAPPSPEEPLAQRVLRQTRTGQLDEDRLLPGQDKRERDLMKKLDKLAAQSGWHTFVSAQAHAIRAHRSVNGADAPSAPGRRNSSHPIASPAQAMQLRPWPSDVDRPYATPFAGVDPVQHPMPDWGRHGHL